MIKMVNITDLANATNITNIDQLIQYGSTATDGWLCLIITASFYLIMLLGFGMYKKTEGILAASFLTFILSTFFLAMNTINPLIPVIFGIITIIALFLQIKQ